jgi:chaperonin GroEL (HSP60 family)
MNAEDSLTLFGIQSSCHVLILFYSFYVGAIADMTEMGVLESFKSKLNVLMSASEAAEMILRVDDIIKCAPRQREERF